MRDEMKKIVNRIKDRRNKLEYSFQDLADRTGMSKSTLQRYESGAIKNLPLDKLEVLARALGVSPAYLMGWEDESKQDYDLADAMAGFAEYEIWMKYSNENLNEVTFILDNRVYTVPSVDAYAFERNHYGLSKEKWDHAFRDFLKTSATDIEIKADALPANMKITGTGIAKVTYPITKHEQKLLNKYRQLSPKAKTHIEYVVNYEIEKGSADVICENVRDINYYLNRVSAGNGSLCFEEPPSQTLSIPNTKEYQNVNYAVAVKGDSMEPLFYEGDTLLIEINSDLRVGDIGIFLMDCELYVKKFGEGELISLNNKYPNIKLNESAKCLGRVVGNYKIS